MSRARATASAPPRTPSGSPRARGSWAALAAKRPIAVTSPPLVPRRGKSAQAVNSPAAPPRSRPPPQVFHRLGSRRGEAIASRTGRCAPAAFASRAGLASRAALASPTVHWKVVSSVDFAYRCGPLRGAPPGAPAAWARAVLSGSSRARARLRGQQAFAAGPASALVSPQGDGVASAVLFPQDFARFVRILDCTGRALAPRAHSFSPTSLFPASSAP